MPQLSGRRRFLAGTGGVAAAAAVGGLFGVRGARAAPASYTATWDSVNQHPAAPEWFEDAKFGIYAHWGVFSVPAYDSEWYPCNMYDAGSNANLHHIATYGDPSVWPYHHFINGGTDRAGNRVVRQAQGGHRPREAGHHLPGFQAGRGRRDQEPGVPLLPTSSGRSPTAATATTRSPTAPRAGASTAAATSPPARSPSGGAGPTAPT